MKVTNEKTENRQAYLKIEVEQPEVDIATAAAYKRLVKQVNVPGFRRGYAPRPVFERHFGKDRLFHEALDDLIPDVYTKAVKEQQIEPIAQPQLEVTQENPIIITAVVPLKPVVTLGDYKSIAVKKSEVNVTDEMVDKVLERLQHQYATWEPVERAAALSDLVAIDVDSMAKGENFINRKGLEYQLTDEQAGPVPGFAGKLIGVNKGEEKEFTLKFPAEYFRKELAGEDVAFKVKINEVKKEVLPEINDQFAKVINKEVESMAVLREKIKEELNEQAEHEAMHEFEDKVVEAAAGVSQVEYPPVLLEAETDHLLERNFRYIQQTGQDLERYLKTIGKTVEQMREEIKPSAQRRVVEALVLGKISDAEKIEATQEEIEAEIEAAVATSREKQEELRKALHDERNRESIINTIVTRKVMQRLQEIALGNIKPEEKGAEKEHKHTHTHAHTHEKEHKNET
ncbi:MAG TPA: trigger factor [Dehalococcoidales bacterium]|nr:trigger factor [Dehalococcoidales bacterium]